MTTYLLGAMALLAVGLLVFSGEQGIQQGQPGWAQGSTSPSSSAFFSLGGIYDLGDSEYWAGTSLLPHSRRG